MAATARWLKEKQHIPQTTMAVGMQKMRWKKLSENQKPQPEECSLQILQRRL
jgi:hypothetical protein